MGIEPTDQATLPGQAPASTMTRRAPLPRVFGLTKVRCLSEVSEQRKQGISVAPSRYSGTLGPHSGYI